MITNEEPNPIGGVSEELLGPMDMGCLPPGSMITIGPGIDFTKIPIPIKDTYLLTADDLDFLRYMIEQHKKCIESGNVRGANHDAYAITMYLNGILNP